MNTLYYGDNLEVLREHIPAESIDLVYLDPPFNSNRNYNVLFARHDVAATDQAQIQAFGDTWRWTAVTEEQFSELVSGRLPLRVADTLSAFRTMIGENDAMAYLVNMTPRLVELHRALKPTGSLWLHVDPTMSHYLKILLDAIFGPEMFRNEVIWARTAAKSLATIRLPSNHDVIFSYAKTGDTTWITSEMFVPYDSNSLDEKTEQQYSRRDPDGRRYRYDNLANPNSDRPNLTYEFLGVTRVWRWTRERMQQAYEDGLVVQTAPGRVPCFKRYLDEQRGKPLSDVWADVPRLEGGAAERLGYPTQKPLALLERILKLASRPGDVVLDPFCGCGTTVDAAERLGRRWVGIDVTYLAVDLIEKRLRHTYGDDIRGTYQIRGIPRDAAGAQALFEHSPFDFERWAVSLVNAQPNEKQVGDKGVDGVARFPLDGGNRAFGRVLMSVKGGKTVGPQFVRDLLGTIQTEKAQMGILITMATPTRGVLDAVNRAGTYTHPANRQTFPRIQTITIDELLQGKRPHMPLTVLPYIQATKRTTTTKTEALF